MQQPTVMVLFWWSRGWSRYTKWTFKSPSMFIFPHSLRKAVLHSPSSSIGGWEPLQRHSLSAMNDARCEPSWNEAIRVFLAEVSWMTWTHTTHHAASWRRSCLRMAVTSQHCESNGNKLTLSTVWFETVGSRCGFATVTQVTVAKDSASFLLLENFKAHIWKASWLPSLPISAESQDSQVSKPFQ